MGVRNYRDLVAWQLACAFKSAVYRLLQGHPTARVDLRYRDQLFSAVESVPGNIAEGFIRFSAADFVRFLDYALGSLAEAQTRLEDGTARGFFDASKAAEAQRLSRRAFVAILRLKHSQQRYLARRSPLTPRSPGNPRSR